MKPQDRSAIAEQGRESSMDRARAVVFVLFGLSGICGLIYEVAWSKYLSMFMGSTAYSHMTVLATFMGGLALGSAYWGRRADRTGNPLRLYGFLEMAIGAFGLLYPFVMVVLEKIFFASLGGLELSSNQPVVLLLKLGMSILSLLFPTFCMGGTLPVLLKLVTSKPEQAGSRVASLYWINSAGAVVGAGAAGFFLVRLYPIDTAIWLTSGLSIAVGLAAVAMARTSGPATGEDAREAPGAPEGKTADRFPDRIVKLAIAAAAGSGFISMTYEVSWIRLLTPILGSSTYSFTVMLIAFISGITLGGWIVGRLLRRRRNLLLTLAWCQIGAALSMLVTMPFYERLPWFLWKLSGAIPKTAENFSLFLFLEFLFCLGLMIVPTTLSGMSLPVVGRIVAGELAILGRRIGTVFSLNTVGAVAGTLVAGLLLIPVIGVKGSIEAAIAGNAILGLFLLSRDGKTATGWKIATFAVVFLLGSWYAVSFPDWNKNVSNLGVFRILHSDIPQSYAEFLALMQKRTVLWYEEGVTANVAVVSYLQDGVPEKSLIINGKADASTGYDLPTQILLAQTPLILGPDSGDVLVIGLGSGVTAGSALTHPIRSLRCVEISPEVVKCNTYFQEENRNFIADPRVRLIVDDAITFVKSDTQKYSCIISEPSNPWIAGIGNLFTSDFFELCKARLVPNGILAQWFHTYDVNDEVFQLVLRTLTRSFDHVTVWAPTASDVILIASTTPIPPDFHGMAVKLNRAAVREDLARIKMNDVPAFLSTQISADLRTTVALPEGPVNTEKHPVLEFLAPVSFFTHSEVGYTAELDRRLDSADASLMLSMYRSERGVSPDELVNVALYQSETATDDFRIPYRALAECLDRDPSNEKGLRLLARISEYVKDNQDRLIAVRGLVVLHPDDPELLLSLGSAYGAWRNEVGADGVKTELPALIPSLRHCVEVTGGEDERCLLPLADMLAIMGRHAEAAEAYAAVLRLRGKYEALDSTYTDGRVASLAAENYVMAGDLRGAESLVSQLRELDPNSPTLAILEEKLSSAKKSD